MQDTETLIDAAQWPEARPVFIPGPLLTDPLSDPIMHMRHMSPYTLKGGRDGSGAGIVGHGVVA